MENAGVDHIREPPVTVYSVKETFYLLKQVTR